MWTKWSRTTEEREITAGGEGREPKGARCGVSRAPKGKPSFPPLSLCPASALFHLVEHEQNHLWRSFETLGHMHMQFFRIHPSPSLWPLAVAGSEIFLPAYSLEWPKLAVWTYRMSTSQGCLAWRMPVMLSPILKFRTNCWNNPGNLILHKSSKHYSDDMG